MRNVIVTGAVVLAISATPAFAGGKKPHASATPMTDQEFVVNASNANTAEVELGKVAENKASSYEVKNFAKLMVADHEKALTDLKAVADHQHTTLPITLDPKNQALTDRLTRLSGRAFDRAYMSAMVRDHRLDIAEFRTEARIAKIAPVKQYASNTLPTLEGHLKLAQEIDHSVVEEAGTRSTK